MFIERTTHRMRIEQYPFTYTYASALVPLSTCTSWQSPQQEVRKHPLTKGTNIFFFQYNNHKEDSPLYYTKTLKF